MPGRRTPQHSSRQPPPPGSGTAPQPRHSLLPTGSCCPGRPPAGNTALLGAFPWTHRLLARPPPAHLLPRCSPVTCSDGSAPPLARTGSSTATQGGAAPAPPPAAPLLEGGPLPSPSLPTPGAPPAPAHSCRPAGTGGRRPSPTVHPLLPWAPSQPLAPCK